MEKRIIFIKQCAGSSKEEVDSLKDELTNIGCVAIIVPKHVEIEVIDEPAHIIC